MNSARAGSIQALFRRQIDSRAVALFRIAHAATGLFYVSGAIRLVDYTRPGHQALFTALYAIWLAVLLLLLVGVHSRITAVASLGLTLICNSIPAAGSIGELLWRIAALWLVFMRPGDAISVDEIRARWRGGAPAAAQPRWPADLAVLSLGVTLLLSGIPKALDPSWRAGDGFYLAMLLPWTHHPWADRIAGSRALTLAGNYAGIAAEIGFLPLIFVPGIRWIAIAGFIGLMTGFGILMSFYFIGAAGASFLPLTIPGARGTWPWRRRSASLELLYDGDCGFCDRSVRLMRAMDTNNRLKPRPIQSATAVLESHGVAAAAALNEMHILEGDRIYHGFRAFRRFAWATPYLTPVAPVLHLPGIPLIGERLYRAIAQRRHSIACAIDAKRTGSADADRSPASIPGRWALRFAAAHVGYLAVFGSAAVLAAAGSPGALQTLNAWRPAEIYNLYTNDLRPLPLFCQVHLFGVYVYRLQGITPKGDVVELLPVFDEHGGPGSCCVAGPRYLQGMMFHVTDDVIRSATVPGYHAPAANLDLYRAAVNIGLRQSNADVQEVRMLVKLLDPPRKFEGMVAPWDRERWTPWLRFPVRNGKVDGTLEWLEQPPRPAYTARS